MKKILAVLALPLLLPGCASVALFGFAADGVTLAKTGKTINQHAFEAGTTKEPASMVLPRGQNTAIYARSTGQHAGRAFQSEKHLEENERLANAGHIFHPGRF